MLRTIISVIAALLLFAAVVVVFVVPGRIEGGINHLEAHDPIPVSAEAQALHDRLFVADLHSDTLLWKRSLLRRANRGHVDLPRLQEGGVALQVFAAPTKVPNGLNYEENTADSDQLTLLVKAQRWPMRTWNSPFERARYMASQLHRADAGSDEIGRAHV